MRIVGVKGRHDYAVWVALDFHHPVKDPYGFCLSVARSKAAALQEAVKCLEEAVEKLQSPPGVLEEWDED